jgi:hypothetical protein
MWRVRVPGQSPGETIDGVAMDLAGRLRALIGDGKSLDDALTQLRAEGASPVACAKAAMEVQGIDGAEAKRLVSRLARWKPETPAATGVNLRTAVEGLMQELPHPPTVISEANPDSQWFARVSLADGPVTWHVERERAVPCLLASPAFSPDEMFDVDILRRFLLGKGYSREAWPRDDAELPLLLGLLRELRPLAAEYFEPANWPTTKATLSRIGRERNHELFGR